MARARSGDGGYWVAIILIGVFFVLSTTLAVLFYTKVEAAEQAAEEAESELAEVVRSGDQGNALYEEAEGAEGGGTVVSRILEGWQADRDQAAALQTSLSSAEQASASFEKTASDRATELATANAQLQTSEDRVAALESELAQAAGDTQAAIAAAREEERAAQSAARLSDSAVQEAVAQAIADAERVSGEASDESRQLARDKRDLEAEVARLESELRDRTPSVRLTRPDGAVAAVLQEGDEVILDRGMADRVPLGLTFRAFKPGEVIRLDTVDDAAEIAGGYASFEVFEVGSDTARARVVSIDRGAEVEVGDPIVNLAYDPELSYRFVVFGEFDLPGVAEGLGEERVRSMIRAWGGEVDPPINPAASSDITVSYQVDYVVLGPEPPEPRGLTAEELSDPAALVQQRRDRQLYDAYQEILRQAVAAGVPVLNQNRFLELVGYYNRQDG
ncbi:MAG: hypothetical protein AAGA57_01975 [Planctomycetota bacterium]